jgi:hypothetical protein
MSRFLIGCGKCRVNLCLLAGGALTDHETAALENHLAACAGCRNYHEETKGVALPLAHWEKSCSHIEPDEAVRARWDKDFQAATEPNGSSPSARLVFSILDWSRDVIWPCRRIWTGLAAIWLVLLFVNLSSRDTGQSLALQSARPSEEIVWAFLESKDFHAEWAKPADPPNSNELSR